MPIGDRNADARRDLKRSLYAGFETIVFPGDYKERSGRDCLEETSVSHSGWYVAVEFNANRLFNGEEYEDLKGTALGPDFHPAEDWNGRGTRFGDLCQPVFPIARGILIGKAEDTGGGNMAFIVHRRPHGELFLSVFAHLHHLPTIEVGTEVTPTRPISAIGSTGYFAEFPHLHWEIRRSGLLDIEGSEVILRRPVIWPAAGSADNGQAFIAANYCEPSTFVRTNGGCGEVLFEIQGDPRSGAQAIGANTGKDPIGQTIRNADIHRGIIHGIEVSLGRAGNPTDKVVIALRQGLFCLDLTGALKPCPDLTTVTVEAATLPTHPEFRTLTLQFDRPIPAEAVNFLVVRRTGSLDNANFAVVRHADPRPLSNVYPGGNYFECNGTSCDCFCGSDSSGQPPYDVIFKLLGERAVQ